MDAYGCKINSQLCADNPEGFASRVICDGKVYGPYATIQEAVECARNLRIQAPSSPATPADAATTHSTKEQQPASPVSEESAQ